MVEGVNHTVSVEIALLQGMLGREVLVNVSTGNDSALCKKVLNNVYIIHSSSFNSFWRLQ